MPPRGLAVVVLTVAWAALTCAQELAVVECHNPSHPPPSEGVCEVTPGDANLLIEATLLTEKAVFRGGQLLIGDDGIIICAGCGCSSWPSFATATRITCAKGVASPGLINLHDHTDWADTPPVDHGTERYDHRHDWRKGLRGHTALSSPSSTGSVAGRSWAELRHLLAGTTSIVGPGLAPYFLRNLNDTTYQEGLYQSPIYASTFPLGDAAGVLLADSCSYPGFNPPYPTEVYLPHVSEGIGTEARNEFLCLSDASLPNGHDVVDDAALIHGIGLTPADVDLLVSGNSSVVWSPRSNISLYGMTAPVTVMDNLGLNLALGTDWLPSGSMNLLRELACAKSLSTTYYASQFSDHDLVGMVTWNAARAAQMDDVIGHLTAGHFADVAIFDGSLHGDDSAVLEASPADVALVLKGGVPMYGDAPVMEALGAGDGQCELIGSGCLDGKRVCATGEGAAAGVTLASLSAMFTNYPLYTCDTPPDEPTCVPSRDEGDGIVYDGIPTAFDFDGDGVVDALDSCPTVFNPPRPLDGFVQADADGDGIGDECDRCPLDPGEEICTALFADGLVGERGGIDVGSPVAD